MFQTSTMWNSTAIIIYIPLFIIRQSKDILGDELYYRIDVVEGD